jgi:hypothetical protein
VKLVSLKKISVEYAVEMDSRGMIYIYIYISSFTKTGICVQTILRFGLKKFGRL